MRAEHKNNPDNLTPSARSFWNKIPPDIRERLLDNVYCVKCRNMTTITGYSGRIEHGDLILNGFCLRCGDPVTRLIEGNKESL